VNVHKSILAAAFALFATFTAAASPKINTEYEQKYFSDIRCKNEVFEELASMLATREWSLPSAREMDGSRRFHTPTQITGVWVEARIFMNGEALLRRITSNFVETRTFDLETCTLKKTARKSREMFDSPDASQLKFTDHDLRQLLEQNSKGLIYIWSPNMPYSYQQRMKGKSGVEIVRDIGRKLGMKVTVVLDPAASAGYARQLVSQHDYMKPESLRSAHSVELSLRAMRTHYPALIVYAGGRLSRHGYPGIGTEPEYTKYIRGELNELQK
jgi:hypothetical protein